MIALLGSTITAGDMGSGGYQCPPEGCPPPPCTVNCGGAAMQPDETELTSVSTSGSWESLVINYVEESFLLFTF